MKIFKSGDYTAEWDDELKPGDLITTYHKGYFEFIKYEYRKGNAPLIHYKLKFDTNGKEKKSGVKTCDAAYCRKAKESIWKEIESVKNKLDNLNSIYRLSV